MRFPSALLARQLCCIVIRKGHARPPTNQRVCYGTRAGDDPRLSSETPEFGAVERVRPLMMTVTAIIAGLLPILWAHGAGADVMKRIAAPMVGGMVSATILTLLVIPVLYSLWREWEVSE